MKMKRTAEFSSISLQLVLCAAAICSMMAGTLLGFFRTEAPSKDSQRTLTFAQRVAYQRSIEEVYWRHRIWPKQRPDPKPLLDAVTSQAQLEKKVTDYLRKSRALADYWQQPITSDQLQAEMDRMAKRTKQPNVLRELFEALGNDPLVIAECLARPVLTERLFNSALASRNVNWTVSQARNSRKRDRARLRGYTLPAIATASNPEGTCIDAWGATSIVNAPTARDSHTAVWTGSELIVWGGADSANTFNTGGRYSPSTDSWTATSIADAPSARLGHTAVWTGSEMIIWGGLQVFPNLFNTGGRYNPATDTWTPTSITNAPAGRTLHTAVWNGSEMIVWGGEISTGYQNTGGRYNPSTDSWTATNTTGAPEARGTHTAVWTGNEMIIWGGVSDSGYLNTGGKYNPATDSWAATSSIGAPFPRNDHTAVWIGNEMIIWGGDTNSPPYYLNTGGRYNPITDSWVATNTTNAPSARGFHTAIWTATDMIIWGGFVGTYPDTNTGGRYSPSTDSWTATSTANAPAGRSDHTAVWTGSEMIVWGGRHSNGQNNQYLNTGGRYCGQYPTPTPTPTATPTAIIEVTNTNDSGPGSLRQALADANDGDMIGFAVTGTIGLTSGELLVGHSITISGPGAENIAVNGNANSTVFHISSGETVTISGLTVTNGYTTGSGGGIHNDHATLTLNNCTISGNTATSHQGGGIYNDAENSGNASLEISNSSLTINSGGAVYNDALGGGVAILNITDSNLNNNFSGGAILSRGWLCTFCGHGTATVQITNSSITGNDGTPYGGAIYSDTGFPGSVTMSLTSSTVSGNATAVHISIEAAAVVGNSTISDNAGGIYNDTGAGGSSVYNSTLSNNGTEMSSVGSALYMQNTIFNVSPGGHSIFNNAGTVHSFGYNVSSDDGAGYLTGPGDQINTDPMLGPLQDNGGPTFTHALLPDSPAINAGDPNFTPPPLYDQRGPGYDRVRNGRLDVGSFEVQEPLTTPTPTATPTASRTATATPTPTSTPSVTPTATPSSTARPTLTPRPNVTPRIRPTPPPRA